MLNVEKLVALKLRLPDATNQDELLQSLLDEAEAAILAMTNRTEMPAALDYTQIKLAAIAYNRMGVEGQSSHSEGGISVGIDSMPEHIRREISPYRLARTR
ncbi:MAG: hypothetical protein GX916_10080 [Clostridiales bacterium]|jgi:hypothetical protein|nr:hypothetical protein [Clostridiales bacterium]